MSERKNRHLLEVAHAMMFQMNIPNVLWGEVVLTKSYFINRKPTHLLKYETLINTLKQCFTASHNLFSFLNPKVFGYTTFVHGQNCSKFDPRAHKCIFLGYYLTRKGYKCYHPQLRKYFMSMDVSFFEN